MQSEIEIARLLGQQLASVMVSANSIRLGFARYPVVHPSAPSDSAIIEIGIGYEVRDSSGKNVYRITNSISEFREGASELLRLIEKTATELSFSQSGDLIIVFGDFGTVRILKDPSGYESYQIHWKPNGHLEV